MVINHKRTLFDYVYQNLKSQIITERLGYQSRLPSMSQLCEFYNVGIRTVKDALHALKEEGYISTQERKAAIVSYSPSSVEESAAIRSILQCKTSIMEVYRTMSILMPFVFSFSVQFCTSEELNQWMLFLEHTKNKSSETRWKACSSFLYHILERSNNLLFRDLFVSLEVYARLPFFTSHGDISPKITAHNKYQGVLWMMNPLLKKDEQETYYRFGLMYQEVTEIIGDYLEELSGRFGNIEEPESAMYSWAADRGRDHYYTQIARDLIDKIGIGIYREGIFLPSEAVLAQQYGVCVSTVRKALSVLNDLGFGKTFNAKGTQVILQDENATLKAMKNKTNRRDALLYLSALQLMTIVIRQAAVLAFEYIDGDAVLDQKNHLQSSDSIFLDCLTRYVISCTPLRPLKTILQEVSKLVYWGYYFLFFKDGPASDNLLNQKTMSAFQRLRARDAEGFADLLSECYCHILRFIRESMIKYGLQEAKGIIPPNMEFPSPLQF